ALRSLMPQCGKTRLLDLIAALCKGHPPVTSSPTAATILRNKRTVHLIDEVDRLRNADKETYGQLMSILNVGYRSGGTVERTERKKDQFEVAEYPVYGPKALAGIENLADTL